MRFTWLSIALALLFVFPSHSFSAPKEPDNHIDALLCDAMKKWRDDLREETRRIRAQCDNLEDTVEILRQQLIECEREVYWPVHFLCQEIRDRQAEKQAELDECFAELLPLNLAYNEIVDEYRRMCTAYHPSEDYPDYLRRLLYLD